MTLWMTIKNWAERHFTQLNGRNLFIALLIYIFLSWILLHFSEELSLTDDLTDFFYYLLVTASTVGYGDLSPSTPTGKWIALLFIIPGGISLFAFTIGHITNVFVQYWKSGLLGKRRLKVKKHILIIGWNEQRTLHLIKMLQHEEKGNRSIVLCSCSQIENPLPGDIEFVHVNNYTDIDGMTRAGVQNASCIIIDNSEDNITFTAALFCSSQNDSAHILVYFNDESLSQLLKQHSPNIECIPSVSIEMLAKSAVDPGSSELHHELLSTHEGMTQYCVTYPDNQPDTDIKHLFSHFKYHHDAILIAIDKGEGVEVNPALSCSVLSGDKLFYIADERVHNFKWL